jgi:hypothetical protein
MFAFFTISPFSFEIHQVTRLNLLWLPASSFSLLSFDAVEFAGGVGLAGESWVANESLGSNMWR